MKVVHTHRTSNTNYNKLEDPKQNPQNLIKSSMVVNVKKLTCQQRKTLSQLSSILNFLRGPLIKHRTQLTQVENHKYSETYCIYNENLIFDNLIEVLLKKKINTRQSFLKILLGIAK